MQPFGTQMGKLRPEQGGLAQRQKRFLSLELGSLMPMHCPHDKLSQPQERGLQRVTPLDSDGQCLLPRRALCVWELRLLEENAG